MPDDKWVERRLALVMRKEDVIEKDISKHIKGYTDKGCADQAGFACAGIFCRCN